MRIAPDSKMLIGEPPGPSPSTIAGILLLGLILTKAGANCSPLEMFTVFTVYGMPISSSATLIFRPFGVFQVCSSMLMRPLSFVAEQDYRDPPSLPTAINDVPAQPRVTLSRPD